MEVINSKRRHNPVLILHTADIHLTGILKESFKDDNESLSHPFSVLEELVNTANSLKADLVLICGDLFDTYHPTQEAISLALEIFSHLIPPAIIIPGNHDSLGDAETYHMPNWENRGFHPYIITRPDGEILEVPDLPVVIWGRAMMEHTHTFRPLAGLPKRNDGAWHVAMAHGFFYDQGEVGDRSSPIHAHEIRHSGWDYIALGHKHIFSDVSQGRVKAAYSGSPVDLWGKKASRLIVKLDSRQHESVSLNRIP